MGDRARGEGDAQRSRKKRAAGKDLDTDFQFRKFRSDHALFSYDLPAKNSAKGGCAEGKAEKGGSGRYQPLGGTYVRCSRSSTPSSGSSSPVKNRKEKGEKVAYEEKRKMNKARMKGLQSEGK